MVLYFLSLYPDLTLADEVLDETVPTNTTTPPTNTTDPSMTGGSAPLGWIAVPVLVLVLVALVVVCVVWGHWLYTAGERRYWGRVHNEHLRAAAGNTNASPRHQGRESSEETDESVDSDRKGLFSWNV